MKFRWTVAPPQPLLTGQLASALKISPLLAQCLVNRGFSELDRITNFLQPRLKNLADPFLLPNMAAAVDRLFQARERRDDNSGSTQDNQSITESRRAEIAVHSVFRAGGSRAVTLADFQFRQL